MLNGKQYLKLTDRELDILNILWSAQKPLVASEITKSNDSLTINTVQAVLRNLLKKELIKVDKIVYSGTVLSRCYTPVISQDDFELQQVVNQIKSVNKKITIPNIVATLLEEENNEETALKELEEWLKKRKKQINKEE